MAHLFCPISGHMLDKNVDSNILECEKSGYRCDMKGLTGVKIVKETDMDDFFKRHSITPLVTHDRLDTAKRVLQRDDHVQCPECKHMGVDFYTKQLRSADEGQTIFYECAECGNKWKENS